MIDKLSDVSPQFLGELKSWLENYFTAKTSASFLPYRKTTSKQVVSSITETDLLNGEVTIGAGLLGSLKTVRLTAFGDWKQNSGAATDVPRFKLKLGGTTLLDTNVVGANVAPNATARAPWRIVCEIMALSATNAQWATMRGEIQTAFSTTLGAAGFVTGSGQTLTRMTNTTSSAWIDYFGGGSGAVDTTVACALVLSVINPANNANVDVTLKGALVEIL